RAPLQISQAEDAVDRRSRRQSERRRLLARRAAGLLLEDHARRPLLGAVGPDDAEEMKQGSLARMLRHEGPAALVPDHELLRLHLAERLAHRTLADPELLGQPELIRQQATRLPGPGPDSFDHQVLDLDIERPEIRPRQSGPGSAARAR